ncbi:heat-shock protein Hsp20 [Methanobacterium subterraneum]|uniref:Heat-shock protein Hsp20 n=1 Tax=Methanobacterium subterraneum TaxID=59277 RepID=A0A2H4VE34_9EURY|nr:Hsp20/alpha crystallin family protein [Methanobacterium subterraneum]AUB56358.1 heat-shock protein Hsp20 [Methanobacterium subterraneum]
MVERKGIDTIFNDMIQTIKERQVDLDNAIAEYTGGPAKPASDILETNEEIVVKTDLPGYRRDDIKIHLTEDTLEIKAEHSEETEEKGKKEGGTFHRKERRVTSAARTLILPARVKINEVSAHFKDGVLTINMPKLEKNETYAVKVE